MFYFAQSRWDRGLTSLTRYGTPSQGGPWPLWPSRFRCPWTTSCTRDWLTSKQPTKEMTISSAKCLLRWNSTATNKGFAKKKFLHFVDLMMKNQPLQTLTKVHIAEDFFWKNWVPIFLVMYTKNPVLNKYERYFKFYNIQLVFYTNITYMFKKTFEYITIVFFTTLKAIWSCLLEKLVTFFNNKTLTW